MQTGKPCNLGPGLLVDSLICQGDLKLVQVVVVLAIVSGKYIAPKIPCKVPPDSVAMVVLVLGVVVLNEKVWRLDAVVVLGRDGVKLVIVAARATECKP